MARTKNKQKKLHVKKGDTVMLTKDITGLQPRQRGYTGRILFVDRKRERVIVEGVNMRVHHERPSQANPQGGRVEKEASIHVSNVQPVDGDGNATRIGRKKIEDAETGRSRWVRYAKTTGEELDQ